MKSFYIIDNLDLFRLVINKKPFFYFSNIKKYLPNLQSISMLCDNKSYLLGAKLVISTADKMDISENIKLKAFISYLYFLQNAIENNSRQHKGTK